MGKKNKKERHSFGSFYYRFPNGESAADVYERVSTFLDSLWRSFRSQEADNYVLITHGIAIRVFLTRYFKYTVDQFHTLKNPTNCESFVLTKNNCYFQFSGRHEILLGTSLNEFLEEVKCVTHVRFQQKLPLLCEEDILERHIRLSSNDHLN